MTKKAIRDYISHNLVMLLFFASALAVLTVSVYMSFMMNSASKFLKSNIEARLIATSWAASVAVKPEELAQLVTSGDMDKPLFGEIKERLISFAEHYDVLFVYYMRDAGGDMTQFIIDNDTTEDSVSLANEPIPFEDAPRLASSGAAATAGLGNYSEGYTGLLSAFAPVFDEEGNVVAVAGVDITDDIVLDMRHRINTMSVIMILSMIIVITSGYLGFSLYKKKARQAGAANVSKSLFLANMSHEMRTPMNAIIGMAAIAKTSKDTEKMRYCLDKIDEASTHLLGVINDILDMSKIEARKLELSLVPFNFAKMLQRVVGVISFRSDEKRQTLLSEVDPKIPRTVVGDDIRIAQVITNLLSNAVKFTQEKGTIKLQAFLDKDDGDKCVIRVEVSDNGIGLTKEQQSHLFKTFGQADNTISRKFGGTGLGLALSKRIVEMSGGKIWIESEPNAGSKFLFTINVEKAEDPPEEPAEEEHEHQPGDSFEGKLLLLAEDVEINREILEELLQPTGIQIECAVNGAQALDMFKASPDKFDIIFMDVQMPEMDGYEATRRIRALEMPRAKMIPIVAMTANVFREDIERCIKNGMNDHLGKPLNIDDVIAKLHIYLNV